MKLVIEYLNTLISDLNNELNEKETELNSLLIETSEIKKTISKLAFYENDTYNVFNASGSKIGFQKKEIVELREQEDKNKIRAEELTDDIKSLSKKIEDLSIVIAHAKLSGEKLKTLDNEVTKLRSDAVLLQIKEKENEEARQSLSDTLSFMRKSMNENKSSNDIISDNDNYSDTDIISNTDNYSDTDNYSESEIFEHSPKPESNYSDKFSIEDENYLNDEPIAFLKDISDRLYFLSKIIKYDTHRVKLEIDDIYKSIKKYINK